MAVDWRSSTNAESYGPIEPLTLKILYEELEKLHGTLSGDLTMDYARCVAICDGFIEELGACLNLSMKEYPKDKEVYDHVFDGLQEVIDLLHGAQDGLRGADGHPRLMDHNESRMVASDKVVEIMDELIVEMGKRHLPMPERAQGAGAPLAEGPPPLLPQQPMTQAEATAAIKKRAKEGAPAS